MTRNQQGMLFAEWHKVADFVGFSRNDRAEREAFTEQVLGVPASWSSLKAGQIDALMGAINRALGNLGLVETEAGLEDYADAAARKRLVWGIERDTAATYAQPEVSIASMLEDICGGSAPKNWRALPLAELDKLRITVAARRKAKFAKLAGN